jgi:hypothetical protein
LPAPTEEPVMWAEANGARLMPDMPYSGSIRRYVMGTVLIIVLVALLLGGGAGYYGCKRYGGSGFGEAVGMLLIVLLVFWFFGGLHNNVPRARAFQWYSGDRMSGSEKVELPDPSTAPVRPIAAAQR